MLLNYIPSDKNCIYDNNNECQVNNIIKYYFLFDDSV